MGIDPDIRRQLIEFAQSQMTRKGEIDALIFTTKDVVAGLRRAQENLDRVTTEFNQALHSIADETETGEYRNDD